MTKIFMVRYLEELVTPKILTQLGHEYPTVVQYFREPLQTAYESHRGDRDGWIQWKLGACRDNTGHEMLLSATFNGALSLVLRLARTSNRRRFDEVTAKAFGDEPPHLDEQYAWRHLFVEGALEQVLSWDPAPWSIPIEEDIRNMEALLTLPKSDDEIWEWVHSQPNPFEWMPSVDVDLIHLSQGAKWFFSATAVAINFLQRLPPSQRSKIRRIVLNEDFKSVSNPACHVRGLIPFYQENNKLRIERRIGICENLLPLGWFGIDRREGARYKGEYRALDILTTIVPWFEEASTLLACGLPSHVYTLIVDGRTPEGIQSWTLMKYVAGLHDAMVECYRLCNKPLPLLTEEEDYGYIDLLLPCYLPPSFVRTVHNIIDGTSSVHIDGFVGEKYDVDVLVQDRLAWTERDWRMEWHTEVLQKYYLTDFWHQLARRYREDGLSV
ncbi:hypothetical protein CC80DRAFT_490842 [Byssothecium circinans]|uniref:Uncharacterized protein n=1 Tax=Byssothecium circinans TaxID=147558 RepID=A0A6A5U5H0_9PLEO|nr:hypothetical protein CC80DRAFT_490842 [Byssothecium circinans]